MTILYKVLGQSNPIANTDTILYTVPSGANTIISTVTVCNLDSNAASFKMAIVPFGDSLASQHYMNFNTTIAGNDTITATLGITLSSQDTLHVNASTALISFSSFGSEIY
jgi:hypothetical protein